jgi:hypothetical protein
VGLLAVLWFHARQTAARVPLLGLAFLGIHSAVVCYGDSIRGYGLGIVTGAFTVAMLWRAVQRSTPRNWALALVVAFLSVHSVFHNAPFLFASACGAVAVFLRRKRWKMIVLPLGIGVVCALTLVPYSLTLSTAKQWTSIFRFPTTISRMWFKIGDTYRDMGTVPLIMWLWMIAAGAVLTAALISPRIYKRLPSRNRELLLFSGVTMIVGILGNLAFLWVLSYDMNPWYFLTTVTIVGISLDGIVCAFPGRRPRLIRVAVAGFMVIICAVPMFKTALERRTNIDWVAGEIAMRDDPGDVIVVDPWWVGYSFKREYVGSATWITIPPLPFPHDPAEINHMGLRRQMQHPDAAMEPVLEKVRSALLEGKRVWIVGDLAILPGRPKVKPLPPYNESSPYKDGSYYDYWTSQLAALLRDHAQTLKQIPVDVGRSVSDYEDEKLYMAEGFQSQPSSTRDSGL